MKALYTSLKGLLYSLKEQQGYFAYMCLGWGRGGRGPAPTASASPQEGLQVLIPTKLVSVTQHGTSRSKVPFASYFSAPIKRSNLGLGPGWAQ